MGYARNTVIAYIQQKHLFAVQISGKYIIPKSALAEFLVTDFAFEIVHKSTWHMNTLRNILNTKSSKPTNGKSRSDMPNNCYRFENPNTR